MLPNPSWVRGEDAMNLFPKIQSPCPVKANIAAYMDGDQCRMCRRQVVDITQFSDAETAAFLRVQKIRSVCLFRKNIGTEPEVRALMRDLIQVLGPEALIGRSTHAIAQLRQAVQDVLAMDNSRLLLCLESFGFKAGVPLDARSRRRPEGPP